MVTTRTKTKSFTKSLQKPVGSSQFSSDFGFMWVKVLCWSDSWYSFSLFKPPDILCMLFGSSCFPQKLMEGTFHLYRKLEDVKNIRIVVLFAHRLKRLGCQHMFTARPAVTQKQTSEVTSALLCVDFLQYVKVQQTWVVYEVIVLTDLSSPLSLLRTAYCERTRYVSAVSLYHSHT